MAEPVDLAVVFLFQKPEQSGDLGPVLQAALSEVEAFSNLGAPRLRISRHVLSQKPIEGFSRDWNLVDVAVAKWKHLLNGPWQPPESEHWFNAAVESELWRSSQGAYKDTLDPQRLLEFVRRSLRRSEEENLLVVMDGRIEPPEDLSYVVARSYGEKSNQTIISTVTMDPDFWDKADDHRRATIKQRFRAITISFVGELLGWEHCPQPTCFMYEFTDYLETLDGMVSLASHHNVAELAELGFAFPEDPEQVQEITRNPRPGGWQSHVKVRL